jgi:hypothetical protein
MMTEQMPLAEQIEWMRVHVKWNEYADNRIGYAVLATLQQHERLTAVVDAAVRFRDDATGSQQSLNALWDALDAIDSRSGTGDAGL